MTTEWHPKDDQQTIDRSIGSVSPILSKLTVDEDDMINSKTSCLLFLAKSSWDISKTLGSIFWTSFRIYKP